MIDALWIVACHFIGDWLLQDRYTAENKSKNLRCLRDHLSAYGIVMIIPAIVLFGKYGWLWLVINVIAHGLQDWYFYRLLKPFMADRGVNTDNYYKRKEFWDVIAVDQMLHFTVLFLTAGLF